jgi:hypothetical protein
VKSVDEVLGSIRRALTDGWHADITSDSSRWPRDLPLGKPTSAAAGANYRQVMRWSHQWHDWAKAHRVALRDEARKIRGVDDRLPTHLIVPDVDTAARLAGGEWPARIAQGRVRRDRIGQRFADADITTAVRQASPLSDTDFDLACTAARWFADNPSVWPGLTPRQVPVEGLHGKWLNTHLPLVKNLAALDDLTLAKRPTRIHFTYLDPTYLARSVRRHDSLTLGDSVDLPYMPEIVLVIENKDTAVLFPELPAAVAVEGNGNAAPGLLPLIPWIANAQVVVYWGDMDAAGYEIVDRLRTAGLDAQTVLMDQAAYDMYERFGTNVDEHGRPIPIRDRKACLSLSPDERVVYENLTNPSWPQHRRVEQERIPLDRARSEIARITGEVGVGSRG